MSSNDRLWARWHEVDALLARALDQPAGTVAAAAEPEGVEVGVVGDLQEGRPARGIVAGEVAGGEKALGVKDNLNLWAGIKALGQLAHPFGNAFVEARAWRHHADPKFVADLEFVIGHMMSSRSRCSCQRGAAAVVIGR